MSLLRPGVIQTYPIKVTVKVMTKKSQPLLLDEKANQQVIPFVYEITMKPSNTVSPAPKLSLSYVPWKEQSM